MQKINKDALKELNDNKKRTVLLQKLLDNPEGELLLEWFKRYYSSHYIDMNNSKQTYFNLGRIEVIKEFNNLINVTIKEKE